MYIVLVVGAAACCCVMLVWRGTDLGEWNPRLSRDHVRRAGWVAGLLAMAVSVILIASGGNPDVPAYLAAVASGLIILCAPPQAHRLIPLAAVAIGLAGLAVALFSTQPPYATLSLPGAIPRASAWRAALILQSAVFLAAGLWLIWRARQSRPAGTAPGEGEGGMGNWARVRSRWGLMLPPAAAVAVLLIDQHPGHPAWKAAAAAVAVALIVVVLVPAAAPDLAAAGLVVLGLCALTYVLSPPPIPHRASPVTAFAQPKPFSAAGEGKLQGAFSAAPQSPQKGAGSAPPETSPRKDAVPAPPETSPRKDAVPAPSYNLPDGSVFASTDGPLDLVGGIEAAAILTLGIWLVPRTIGVHARALLRSGPDAELAGRVEQLTQTRADAVDTAATELRRLERDLHDGAQARLVALGMNLRAAERLIPTSPQAAIALVAEAREASSRALTELRDLVRGVYPPVLADRGLADAVRALALDTPIRTETDINVPGRLDPPVESACYFAVAEALTNAVKHSAARLVQIRIRYSAGAHSPGHPARPSRLFRPAQPSLGLLRIEVTDDGTGGADPARGSGLQGVERRLGTFDGILAVSSPPGGPTIIVMEIPCALSSRRTSSC
jgi:signal transduction histidine kinase